MPPSKGCGDSFYRDKKINVMGQKTSSTYSFSTGFWKKGQAAYFESHLPSHSAKTIMQSEGGKIMRSHYPCAVGDVLQIYLFLCK